MDRRNGFILKKSAYKYMFLLCMLAMVIGMPLNVTAASQEAEVSSDKEMENEVYKALVSRKNSFSIVYEDSITNILDVENEGQITDENASSYVEKILANAYAMDKETSDDFDYLAWSISSYEWVMDYESGTMYPIFEFEFEYLESASQTKKVNEKVKKILTSLKVKGKSDYKKVKLIHDYLVNNMEYDIGYTNYSAYDALIKKTAVCQGYSLAMYKLLIEAGVPCRILTGNGDGESHAWNMVSIDGIWYCIDVTWDDPIGGTQVGYDYFLKGSKTFEKEHTLDSEYRTKSFKKKYPISKTDYKK